MELPSRNKLAKISLAKPHSLKFHALEPLDGKKGSPYPVKT